MLIFSISFHVNTGDPSLLTNNAPRKKKRKKKYHGIDC
jgi:hypothetical protein